MIKVLLNLKNTTKIFYLNQFKSDDEVDIFHSDNEYEGMIDNDNH